MEDAEVLLVFSSPANTNRVEELQREARSPGERETTDQSKVTEAPPLGCVLLYAKTSSPGLGALCRAASRKENQ